MALGVLLRREGVDVVLLQEANVSSLEVLRDAAGLDWAVTAYDAGAPYPGGRSGRGRVTAVAGRGDEPTLARILPDLPLPERMVFARIGTPLGPITMASYHAPPGVSHGFVKVQHAHALRDWVDTTGGPIVVGADANTPLVDHPEPGRVRTHWHTGSLKLRGRDGDDVVFAVLPSTDFGTRTASTSRTTRKRGRKSIVSAPMAPWRSRIAPVSAQPSPVLRDASTRCGSARASGYGQ